MIGMEQWLVGGLSHLNKLNINKPTLISRYGFCQSIVREPFGGKM
jgi:hypothetical protein